MIVIPMAGLSSRFFKEGYLLPKYMLDVNGITLFEWAVSSFSNYYKTDHFVFIILAHYDTESFVREQVEKIGIVSYEIVILNEVTKGQAETVYKGICHYTNDDQLYIFNIDSRLNNFNKVDDLNNIEGYLEVFEGEGEHWSFVLPGRNNEVLKTTEKERISNLCSNGLYYFKSSAQFKHHVEREVEIYAGAEIYIAPLYNYYIQNSQSVIYKKVLKDDIEFCGTPQEYTDYLKKVKGCKV